MNESMVLGILCGLLIGGIVVVIILKLTKEDGSVKCKYDERQQLVRGIGFKYGFLCCSSIIFFMAWQILRQKGDIWTAEPR